MATYNPNRGKKQNGFTLIELISVIIILGVLAAVAMPRFISMSTEARIAKMKAVAGALGSAVTMASAKWLTADKPSYIWINGATAITYVNGAVTPVTVMRLIEGESVKDVATFSVDPFNAGGSVTLCEMTAASWTSGPSSTWGCNAGTNKCAIKYTASPDGQPMTFALDTTLLTEANCK